MTPDVNVLVAASRSDHPQHKAALAWLERAVSSARQGAAFCLQPMIIASFLRLVTHPRIFVQPTPMVDAVHFIEVLLEASGTEPATLGGEWPTLRQLCVDKALSDNDVPAAWLAAAAIHQGEHVVSFDADFKRLLPGRQFTLLLP